MKSSLLRRGKLMGSIFGALLVTMQCGTESAEPKPAGSSTQEVPDIQPVADSAPYWCGLTPKAALENITGIEAGLSEYPEGWRAGQGGCLVRDGSPAGPLGISWNRRAGRKTVLRQEAKYRDYKRERLPEELGYGFVAHAPGYTHDRPYYVIAHFRCGAMEPWLSLDVSRVRDGRDYREDLTALMRIAEERFGALHGCEPGPPKIG